MYNFRSFIDSLRSYSYSQGMPHAEGKKKSNRKGLRPDLVRANPDFLACAHNKRPKHSHIPGLLTGASNDGAKPCQTLNRSWEWSRPRLCGWAGIYCQGRARSQLAPVHGLPGGRPAPAHPLLRTLTSVLNDTKPEPGPHCPV